MAQKRSKYHHGNLSEALVAAGVAFLRDNSAEQLSLRAVAERVGVSRTAPYAHFPDKRALLLAISAAGFQRMADAMEADRQTDAPASQKIVELGTSYVHFALDNPNLYRVMISSLAPTSSDATDDPFRNTWKKEATRPYAMLRAEFARAVEDAETVETLAQGAWGMVHGLASLLGEGLIAPPKGGVSEILHGFMHAQKAKTKS